MNKVNHDIIFAARKEAVRRRAGNMGNHGNPRFQGAALQTGHSDRDETQLMLYGTAGDLLLLYFKMIGWRAYVQPAMG